MVLIGANEQPISNLNARGNVGQSVHGGVGQRRVVAVQLVEQGTRVRLDVVAGLAGGRAVRIWTLCLAFSTPSNDTPSQKKRHCLRVIAQRGVVHLGIFFRGNEDAEG